MFTKAYLATLDDDEEAIQDIISNYSFYDEFDEPISFIELPIRWSNGESSYDNKHRIYLKGTIDYGLQRLHKQVKAWKYECLKEKPEISVLLKDNIWIKLQKPRKSYEGVIRTILITVHCLHFCKGRSQASSSSLWNYLHEIFSLYDVRPSEDDLIHHLYFIAEAVKRDKTLQKSKFLASFLEGKRRKKKVFDQNDETVFKPSFIVEDAKDEYDTYEVTTKESKDNQSEDEDYNESESEDDNKSEDEDYNESESEDDNKSEDEDYNESESEDDNKSEDEDDIESEDGDDNKGVCAICDNGGDLTCCDGKCLRSFHATVESAEAAESKCISLCLPAQKVKGLQSFVCLNCTHEQHQCFACGELGSSNESSGAEVFRCSSETCGHFYHPKCVAQLIQDESDTRAQFLEEKIAGGKSFICPVHKCHKCKQEENEKVRGLQFAICRRCPTSYHRKCLPRNIVFDNEDDDEFVVARAWNDLLPKSRALIFCLKHEIDLELHTPVRNIKFPDIGHTKEKVSINEEVSYSNCISSEIRVEKAPSSVRPVDISRKRFITLCGPDPMKKQRLTDYEKPLKKFVPVRSFGHSSTVVENWKNSNIAVAQQHGHISKVQEPLLSENVDAFDLQVENPEIVCEKDTSQTIEKAENLKSSKHIAIAQQHGHISTVQGPLLSDEHVEAFDLPLENRDIVSEKNTSQTTEKVENCKSSKFIAVAQKQGPISKVQELLPSENVEVFDLPVKNHEVVGEKDTSRKTEVENRKSSKHIAIVQQHGHTLKVQEPPHTDENVEVFDLPVENHESVSEKDTTSQTTEEMETRVSKELPISDRYIHLPNSPVEICKSNGEKNTGQTTKKRENRNSRKRRRRSKRIAITQQNAHISKIQEPTIPDKFVHPFNSQVKNCDLNVEKDVSQTKAKAAAATSLIRSQKESSRCDRSNSHNIATRDASATDVQPYHKSRILNDDVHFRGYERENDYHYKRGYVREAYDEYRDRRGYSSEANNEYYDRCHHHDSISTPAIQRYTPKLDEGNHKWMEKRRTWLYDYDHHRRGCDPHMYANGFASGPFPHGPHLNSSCCRIDERMYY